MLKESCQQDLLDSIYFAGHQQGGWEKALLKIVQMCCSEAGHIRVIDLASGALLSRIDVGQRPVTGEKSGCWRWEGAHGERQFQVCLELYRLPTARKFTKDEALQLDSLMPHVGRAFRQNLLTQLISDRQAALRQQGLGALLLLDADKKIVYCTPQADALLQGHPGVSVREGGLTLTQPATQVELDALLDNCLAQQQMGTFQLKANGGAGLRLLVNWLDDERHSLLAPRAMLVVFVIDSAGVVMPEWREVSQWLGLTEAESRIAVLVAQGLRPNDIADAMVLSVHTVRHHIKNIYRKTDTHSQSRLTGLILNLPSMA